MAGIKPVDLNAAIGRTQDFSQIKQNENNKGMTDQQNFQMHFRKETEHHKNQVISKEDAQHEEYKYDAKEKGNGEYHSKKKKEQKQKKSSEKIVPKSEQRQQGFDIRI